MAINDGDSKSFDWSGVVIVGCVFLFFGYIAFFGEKKPIVPVEMSFRQSALDSSGLVLIAQNTSKGHLSCVLTVENKILNQRERFSISFGPHEKREF